MAQRGGLSHIHYKETKGLKVNAGQSITKGTILTREGDKWKAGLNISGRGTLYAKIDGKVYFTKKRGNYKKNKLSTFINISPVESPRGKSPGGTKTKKTK